MHLDAFDAELRKGGGPKGQPLASAPVRKVHVILHAAFAQAIRWGLIASNPANAATAPSTSPRQITLPAPDALAGATLPLREKAEQLAEAIRHSLNEGGLAGVVPTSGSCPTDGQQIEDQTVRVGDAIGLSSWRWGMPKEVASPVRWPALARHRSVRSSPRGDSPCLQDALRAGG
ncbi:MAG: hypothetical protein JJE52_11820 [Acidimicrobiia bacterium]|nr:hypothetical protein [Acidimicrobiia bacterium]